MSKYTILLLTGALPLCAAVEFDAIYGDGMVLQRGREVVVRGTTDKPSEPVTVKFNGQTVKAEAKGTNWRALQYTKDFGFWYDIKIMFKTVKEVIS